jgi:hypothetical protein
MSGGLVSFANSRLGALQVGGMVARSPEPKYECVCGKCSSAFVISHSKIRNRDDRCPNSACGIETTSRQLAAERKAGKRDAIANAAQLERQAREAASRESNLRMEAETADYKRLRPLSEFRPTEAGPQSERQRLAARQRREELAAEEEARMAPVRAAEAKLKDTHRKLAAIQRDTLTNPEIIDIEPFISEGFENGEMSWEDAKIFNGWNAKKFMENHPEFLPSDRNLETIGQYFDRNKLFITTLEMIENLYQRMVDAGVGFDQRPPEPEAPSAKLRPYVNLNIARAPVAPTYEGWDVDTGEKRTYSEWQVRHMSSETFKRTFRLTPDKLTLPNIGPGPHGWQQA